GIEVDLHGVVGECLLHIGGPALDAGALGERLELHRIPAHQDRLGDDRLRGAHPHPALLTNSDDRPEEVLIGSHPAGHPVHRDPYTMDFLLVCHEPFYREMMMMMRSAIGQDYSDAAGGSVHCGHAFCGSGGASTPAFGRVPSSSCFQWATSPAGP